jgi:hypothetical protein
MMDNNSGPTRPALVPVVITFSVASILSFLIFLYFEHQESVDQYQVMFDDDSVTYGEDGILLSNQGMSMNVYQINDNIGYISSSSFINEKGDTIEASGIKFNGASKLDLRGITPEPNNPHIINLAISPHIRGVFQGWFVLTNPLDTSSVYIPIVISTIPYQIAPIFLVLSGVCASVCVWEYWRYLRAGPTTTRRELQRIGRVREQLQRGLFANTTAKRDNLEESSYRAIENNITRRAAAYAIRSQQPISKRIAVIEIVPSILGIIFGLFVTVNDYVPNLLYFDLYQSIILFGIGLGSGSLKELVDKDSETGCMCIEPPEKPIKVVVVEPSPEPPKEEHKES